jgi:CDP-diacylglycerol--glycerol-3-phosphate 3-phosphatidyltransferase
MNASPSARERLRNAPNVISALRIAAVPVLLGLAFTGRQSAFTWVLVPALLSDIADGWIARRFQLQSQLGAFLDSVADTLLLFVSIYGMWVFHRDVITSNGLVCVAVTGLWILENVLALLRYGRLSSFHTYVSKVAGYMLGIYIGVLFVFGHSTWLLHTAAVLSIIGNLEEFALLVVLPQWRANVRGLWWILAERRERSAS